MKKLATTLLLAAAITGLGAAAPAAAAPLNPSNAHFDLQIIWPNIR